MGGITQANSWSDVSKCFAKPTVARSCQDAQDGYLYTKKTNPKICYKDPTWRDYLTGYWGKEAVCGGAICEMEPGLALALTPQPYRDWWKGSCSVAQCEFSKEDNYQVLGTGSCRSANVWTYPNHYLKIDSTPALTRSACVKQATQT